MDLVAGNVGANRDDKMTQQTAKAWQEADGGWAVW